MIEVKKSTFNEIQFASNINKLLSEYANESSIEGMPKPNAKFEMYNNLERAGTLHCFIAKLEDLLIGFIVVITPTLPHYSALVAVVESFFVSSDYRKTGAGTKLLKEAENLAIDLKSPGLLVSAPSGGRLDQFLSCSAYKETNRVFFRKLS